MPHFGFGFVALLCFVLDRLSPSTLLSDDPVKTKFTLIAGVEPFQCDQSQLIYFSCVHSQV